MEEATTLADALLEDLDDLNDSDDDELLEPESQVENNQDGGADVTISMAMDASTTETTSLNTDTATTKETRFLGNRTLQKHLTTIRARMMDSVSKPSASSSSSMSQVERQERDHQLVVQSNKQLNALTEELTVAHHALAAAYQPKFPELEELVPNIVQYKNAVRTIWNEMDLTKVNDPLNEILHSNQIITISVAGSTTSGRPLTDEELQHVDAAATYMDSLLQVQRELVMFVEQSMEALAPSICALIGAPTAARLLGLAGGLAELTKIPACNLQVLGQVKQNSASRGGLSTSNRTNQVHVGILADCDLVQSMPAPLKKKALKTVAAKLALCARYDFVNVDTGRPRSAKTGRQFRQDVQAKFEKLIEPDKAPVLKALPKPDLTVKKRRGGKRMRRYKERFEETAMMKQANTRAFSTQQGEYGDDAMGITMGLLDTADSGGAIRKTTEKIKMRQANTKASRKRAMEQSQKAQNKDGLASSVVFSQTTSMELVNPDANKDRVRNANRKWFDEHAGFQSALPKKEF